MDPLSIRYTKMGRRMGINVSRLELRTTSSVNCTQQPPAPQQQQQPMVLPTPTSTSTPTPTTAPPTVPLPRRSRPISHDVSGRAKELFSGLSRAAKRRSHALLLATPSPVVVVPPPDGNHDDVERARETPASREVGVGNGRERAIRDALWALEGGGGERGVKDAQRLQEKDHLGPAMTSSASVKRSQEEVQQHRMACVWRGATKLQEGPTPGPSRISSPPRPSHSTTSDANPRRLVLDPCVVITTTTTSSSTTASCPNDDSNSEITATLPLDLVLGMGRASDIQTPRLGDSAAHASDDESEYDVSSSIPLLNLRPPITDWLSSLSSSASIKLDTCQHALEVRMEVSWIDESEGQTSDATSTATASVPGAVPGPGRLRLKARFEEEEEGVGLWSGKGLGAGPTPPGLTSPKHLTSVDDGDRKGMLEMRMEGKDMGRGRGRLFFELLVRGNHDDDEGEEEREDDDFSIAARWSCHVDLGSGYMRWPAVPTSGPKEEREVNADVQDDAKEVAASRSNAWVPRDAGTAPTTTAAAAAASASPLRLNHLVLSLTDAIEDSPILRAGLSEYSRRTAEVKQATKSTLKALAEVRQRRSELQAAEGKLDCELKGLERLGPGSIKVINEGVRREIRSMESWAMEEGYDKATKQLQEALEVTLELCRSHQQQEKVFEAESKLYYNGMQKLLAETEDEEGHGGKKGAGGGAGGEGQSSATAASDARRQVCRLRFELARLHMLGVAKLLHGGYAEVQLAMGLMALCSSTIETKGGLSSISATEDPQYSTSSPSPSPSLARQIEEMAEVLRELAEDVEDETRELEQVQHGTNLALAQHNEVLSSCLAAGESKVSLRPHQHPQQGPQTVLRNVAPPQAILPDTQTLLQATKQAGHKIRNILANMQGVKTSDEGLVKVSVRPNHRTVVQQLQQLQQQQQQQKSTSASNKILGRSASNKVLGRTKNILGAGKQEQEQAELVKPKETSTTNDAPSSSSQSLCSSTTQSWAEEDGEGHAEGVSSPRHRERHVSMESTTSNGGAPSGHGQPPPPPPSFTITPNAGERLEAPLRRGTSMRNQRSAHGQGGSNVGGTAPPSAWQGPRVATSNNTNTTAATTIRHQSSASESKRHSVTLQQWEEKRTSRAPPGDASKMRKKEGILWVLSKPLSGPGGAGGDTPPRSLRASSAWKECWVVLSGSGHLGEYADWRRAKVLEPSAPLIDLRFATIREGRGTDRPFVFEVVTRECRRFYQAEGEDQLRAWKGAISMAIESLLRGTGSVRQVEKVARLELGTNPSLSYPSPLLEGQQLMQQGQMPNAGLGLGMGMGTLYGSNNKWAHLTQSLTDLGNLKPTFLFGNGNVGGGGESGGAMSGNDGASPEQQRRRRFRNPSSPNLDAPPPLSTTMDGGLLWPRGNGSTSVAPLGLAMTGVGAIGGIAHSNVVENRVTSISTNHLSPLTTSPVLRCKIQSNKDGSSASPNVSPLKRPLHLASASEERAWMMWSESGSDFDRRIAEMVHSSYGSADLTTLEGEGEGEDEEMRGSGEKEGMDGREVYGRAHHVERSREEEEEAAVRRMTKAQLAEEILEIASREENRRCADCGEPDPRWASWSLHGQPTCLFICISCSGIHRSLGVHISKVKSVDLDDWTLDQVLSARRWGNRRVNEVWERRKLNEVGPGSFGKGSERFWKIKYVEMGWREGGWGEEGVGGA